MEDSSAFAVGVIALASIAVFALLFWIWMKDGDVILNKHSRSFKRHARINRSQDRDIAITRQDIHDLQQVLKKASAPTAAPAPAPAPKPALTPLPALDTLESVGAHGHSGSANALVVRALMEKIMSADDDGDGLKATAALLKELLKKEDVSAVQGGLAPLFGTSSVDTDVDRMLSLASALKSGHVPAGNQASLFAMYEKVFDSLSKSTTISDTTRQLMGIVVMERCKAKHGDDTAAMMKCFNESPHGGVAGASSPVNTPLGSTPAVTSNVVLTADGLQKIVPGGTNLAFSFQSDRVRVCGGSTCYSVPLSRDYPAQPATAT
jgi:hypothetical protein